MANNRSYILVKLSLGEIFEEITTRVFKYVWLNNYNAINGGFNYFHYFSPIRV